MAAGAMLLGFLPTILALGGRPNTTEVGLLSLRRPLLASLLGFGTPAITSVPTFEYRNSIEVLRKHHDSLGTPKLSKPWTTAIVAFEYIFACAAIANVAHTSWQLGLSSVCSFAPSSIFLPALWTLVTPLIHWCGTLAIVRRTTLTTCVQGGCQKTGMFTRLFRHELQLCSQQPPASLAFRRESRAFIILSLITSTAAVAHLAFGTVVLSSTLFVGTGDAVMITARYFASTAVCQLILMFEISGMRQIVNIESEQS